MQKTKWTTTKQYVDIETGERLTEYTVKQKYIIIRKKITNQKTKQYETQKYGGKLLTERGIKTIIYECTREGKQLKLIN